MNEYTQHMRIAIISVYSGINNRGVESFVNKLANYLSSKKVDITVFQAGKTSKTNYKITVIPQTIRTNQLQTSSLFKRLFIDNTRIDEFKFFYRLLPHLKDFDIIIPLISGWPIVIIKLICWLSNIKLVMIGQSGPGWDDRWNLFWHPDIFVCLTNAQKKWAQKASIWKSQKYTVIPNGVDLQQFSPKGARVKLQLQKPTIVCAAASTYAKRIEDSIRAIAKLNKGSLLLLGKGPLDSQINKLGKGLLGDKRFLHKSVRHDKVPTYFRSADIFTLCSESSEAFGTVYVEALATNLACVATNDESRHEIVGDAGLFVSDPTNHIEYSQALHQSLTTDWKNKPLLQAKAYDWQVISDQYYKTFDLLLSNE